MNVSVGARWEGFIDGVVQAGRYRSASEVVREGLRLVEERESKLQALRDTINAAIEGGGSYTGEEVLDHVRASLEQRRRDAAA